MQLVPVLMALRDSVGLERVIVDTYQAVSGTGGGAIRELEGQVRAHVAGQPKDVSVYPHQIAFNALPQIDVFLPNGYTKEEWKVVSESRKILHLPDLRVSCTAVRVPVFVAHSEAVHVETRAPITPDRARDLFAAVQGVVVQDDPSTSTYPLATTAAGTDEIYVGPGPPGSVDRRRSRPGLLGRLATTSAKGRRRMPIQIAEVLVECGWVKSAVVARRDPLRAGGSGDRGRSVTSEDRRAALEAIAGEVRTCTKCRLAANPHARRPGGGECRHGGRLRRRGPRIQRGSPGPSLRRPCGRPARQAPRLDRVAARGRLHHERREVPAAGQPRPRAGRDRRLRPVPPAPARGPRSGARRDPRSPLDGPVPAGRPDLAGPRDDGTGRSGDRSPRRDGARDVPPGGGVAHAGDRARELRRTSLARRGRSSMRGRVATGLRPRRRPPRRPHPATTPGRSSAVADGAPGELSRSGRRPHDLLTTRTTRHCP